MSFIHIHARKEGDKHLIAKLKCSSFNGPSHRGFPRSFHSRLEYLGLLRNRTFHRRRAEKRRFIADFIAGGGSPAYQRRWFALTIRKSTRYRHLALVVVRNGSGVLPHTIGDALIRGWLRNAPCIVSVSFITALCLISAPTTWLRQSRRLPVGFTENITRMCTRDLRRIRWMI